MRFRFAPSASYGNYIPAKYMKCRLTTILYVFALLAAGMAAFGPAWGIVASLGVLSFGLVLSDIGIGRVAQWAALLSFLFTLVALLMPAVSSRSSPLRDKCQHQIKQIALGLLNYHDAHGALPPVHTVDEHGRRLHSWRVLILPFIGEQTLYDEINLQEPWDGPNNGKLAERMPAVYACPSCVRCRQLAKNPPRIPSRLSTNYFAVVGPETAMRPANGRSISDIVGGTSKTVTIIESADHDVNWMSPTDLSLDEAVDVLCNPNHWRHVSVYDDLFVTRYRSVQQGLAAYADGHAGAIVSPQPDEARAMLTVAGEPAAQSVRIVEVPTPADEFYEFTRWDKVFIATLFWTLAALPGVLQLWRVLVYYSRGGRKTGIETGGT